MTKVEKLPRKQQQIENNCDEHIKELTESAYRSGLTVSALEMLNESIVHYKIMLTSGILWSNLPNPISALDSIQEKIKLRIKRMNDAANFLDKYNITIDEKFNLTIDDKLNIPVKKQAADNSNSASTESTISSIVKGPDEEKKLMKLFTQMGLLDDTGSCLVTGKPGNKLSTTLCATAVAIRDEGSSLLKNNPTLDQIVKAFGNKYNLKLYYTNKGRYFEADHLKAITKVKHIRSN